MTRRSPKGLVKPALVALAALTAAGCATRAPAPAPHPRPPPPALSAPAPAPTPVPTPAAPVVDQRLTPPPAAAPVIQVKTTPLDQLGAAAKMAVFPDMSPQQIADALSSHAARCWRGPGAPFPNLAIADDGLLARDLSGAELLRVRYAAINARLGAAAFTGPAFTPEIESEAADAVRGRSLCKGEIPSVAGYFAGFGAAG